MKIEGDLFRVEVEPHPQACEVNGHHMISVYVEDDGHWHHKMTFASSWLPELQMLLATAHQSAHQPGEKP